MELNKLASEVHAVSKQKGWWEKDRSFPEVVALCHAELSEALECYRDGKLAYHHMHNQEAHPPEGMDVEMADCIMRILDWFAYQKVDVEKLIKAKLEYNKARAHRHGGKL